MRVNVGVNRDLNNLVLVTEIQVQQLSVLPAYFQVLKCHAEKRHNPKRLPQGIAV